MGSRWSNNPVAWNMHQMCGGNIIIIINYLTWFKQCSTDKLQWPAVLGLLKDLDLQLGPIASGLRTTNRLLSWKVLGDF